MCSNDAVISAKYDNAGGILGYGSRGFLLGCESGGSVNAGREYAGGIAGRLSGTIRECGSITALDGKAYVGGIAGRSDSSIRLSWAKCTLSGEDYVGGIAGYGKTLSDCRSLVTVAARTPVLSREMWTRMAP